jgi:glyoxylate/hydroxypyruvate reductase A
VNGWSRGPHDLAGIACYHGHDQLAACPAPCDYAVCVLPETSQIRDIDAGTLALMKRGAYFHISSVCLAPCDGSFQT